MPVLLECCLPKKGHAAQLEVKLVDVCMGDIELCSHNLSGGDVVILFLRVCLDTIGWHVRDGVYCWNITLVM